MKVKWSAALLCSAVAAVSLILTVSAAPLSAPALDGDGLMDVAPTNLTYGTSSSLIFTFTANNDFASGSQVALTIPAGWSAPTTANAAGHVSVSQGTCVFSGSPGWQIDGPTRTVLVDLTSCLTGSSFTINYNGTPPGVSGLPSTFNTQTDIGPGGQGLVNINAPMPAVSIDPKALTVSGGLTPTSKQYDGTTTAGLSVGAPSLVGVLPGDNVTLVTTGALADFVDRNAGTGKAVTISGLTLSGAQASNYTITPPTRSANIMPYPITITAVSESRTYDGTTSSAGLPTITSGTAQAGDTEPTWTQTFNNRNAGSTKTLTPAGLMLDGNGGLNYAYTYATTTGSISKYPLTVTAASASKTYDRTTASNGHPTITSGTIQGGDTEPAWTQAYDSANAGTGKTLTPAGLVNDGNAGKNYSYTYAADTTGVILPKALTVSSAGLTPNNKTYDGTASATGVTGVPSLVGVISGDTVTLTTTGAMYAFADKNAGNGKVVHVSGLTLGGAQAGNYNLTQPNRTANIARRPITVTAVTDSRAYDGTNHSAGAPSITGGAIQAGDIEPAWTQTFNNQHAGTGKTLTPAGKVVDGNGGNNYIYTFVANSTGVITKRDITVTAISDTKIYDGTTHSADIPNYAPSLVGSDTAGFSQSFSTKNAGTSLALRPAGIVNDGNSGNDYAYHFVNATAGAITVRPITVTAVSDSRSYDGTLASAGAPMISPGLYGTDTSGFTQAFDSKDVGGSKTLTPAGMVNDGNSGNNYSYTFVTDTTGSITAAGVTVTANPQAKAQGAPEPTLTYSVTPALFAGDAMTGALGRSIGESYGTYAINQGTLSAGSNYAITFLSANLLIGPAISGNVGTPGALLSYTDLVPKSVTADGSGNYSLIVTSGWTGTVTPGKAGFAFTPGSIAYTAPVTSDTSLQNYIAHPLVTRPLPSIGGDDGWVLESGAVTSVGGLTNSAGTTFMLGDDATRKQYRAILSFGTGGLPANAVVTGAKLTLRKQSISGGGNPFSMFQGLYVDVRKGYFGTSRALQGADFQAAASTNRTGLGPFNPVPAGALYSITLPASALPYINVSQATSLTQLRLRFKLGDNANAIANYITFYSGNYATGGYRPTLTITYYLP